MNSRKNGKLMRVWKDDLDEFKRLARKNQMSLAQFFNMALRKMKSKKLEVRF